MVGRPASNRIVMANEPECPKCKECQDKGLPRCLRCGRPLKENSIMTPEETIIWKYRNQPIGTDFERTKERREKATIKKAVQKRHIELGDVN